MTDAWMSRPTGRSHRAGALPALVTALLLLATGCVDGLPSDAITMINDLDHNVRVVEAFNGAEGAVEPVLRPGADVQLRTECIDGDLVAISSVTNEEVDRREGPICRGDDVWHIDGIPG